VALIIKCGIRPIERVLIIMAKTVPVITARIIIIKRIIIIERILIVLEYKKGGKDRYYRFY